MPGGKYDSSKTRVGPIFRALWNRGRDWLPRLLALPTGGCTDVEIKSGDLTLLEGYWEPREKCLKPPVSLLSWLIRNVDSRASTELNSEHRLCSQAGDSEKIEQALHLLRTKVASRAWYIFEGLTCPDVYLVACEALVIA